MKGVKTMKKTFVARTIPGREYMYNTRDAFYVNPKKAQFVADYLNKTNYLLFNGPYKWQVFKDDGEFVGPEIVLRAVVTQTKIRFYEIDNV